MNDITHSPVIAITFRCNCSQFLHTRSIGFLADWISAYVFIKGNKERLVLYFLVSFLGTFLTIFLVLSIRLYVQKRRAIRLLKETAPLVSPISDISYEVHRDTTLDPLDISVPTSHTTLNHGHHQHSLHPHQHHNPSRLPLTLTSVVTGGGGHTQTHLDGQYQPLLTSPRHHHRSSSSHHHSPHTSHSVSQSPQQSPQRLFLMHPDSSQMNSSSSPQPNTSINSSNATNGTNLIVNSDDNSPVDTNLVDNLITPSTDEGQRVYASVPPSSQRRSTRESSSPRTINSIPSTDQDNSPRSTSISSNNQPNQRANSMPRQQPNELIIGCS